MQKKREIFREMFTDTKRERHRHRCRERERERERERGYLCVCAHVRVCLYPYNTMQEIIRYLKYVVFVSWKVISA